MITRDLLQHQALKEAMQFKKSGLQLATGTGKTKIGLDYIMQITRELVSNIVMVIPSV